MPILMDEILRGVVDRAARLRRNGVPTARDLVSAELLAELEATGDAMRCVTSRGQIAWKATPRLHYTLMDVHLDAEDNLEDI
jgi:hypothetical protein